MIILSCKNVYKKYKKEYVVKNICLELEEKKSIGIIGENGAGKTTTLKMIYSALNITKGKIYIAGIDNTLYSRQTKELLGIVSQEDMLDSSLNVIENLVVHAVSFNYGIKESYKKSLEILKFIELDKYKNSKIYELSGGMRRRLVLGRALINNPKLIILDEPTVGLDIQSRNIIWRKLNELMKKGTSIIITSHYMNEIENLCENIIIMKNGEFIYNGSIKKIKEITKETNLEKIFLKKIKEEN
ncbi:ABC transporter ATP-binding protein [Oceanivirga salmonicida]|uniref:ABC transporter ATP-binding protein n=1 Tax=Oceanivirga salmonicida TaxID=1769291 RepID=UPI0012E0EFDD|nr:ABC transporter ATP-binding protein [Oceanivirga salmonicida]